MAMFMDFLIYFSDICSQNSNIIKYDGIIYNGSINADSEYFNNPNKDIYYHLLANTDNNSIIGFPTGVYAYGVLITFSGSTAFDNYAKCQIYIPHGQGKSIGSGNVCVCFRTLGDIGDSVDEKTWRVYYPNAIVKAASKT